MTNLKEIDSIVKSDQFESNENYVAIAVCVNENGFAKHAGIIICNDKVQYLFHFDSKEIQLTDIPNGEWYFHKKIDFIKPDFVPAFLAHCKNVKKTAKPKFGFFFSGTYYDVDGKFYTDSGITEYMTCVGFCINVIRGLIENTEYFEFNDWDDSAFKDANGYFENFLKLQKSSFPDENIDQHVFRENLRRIKPSELLTSTFINEIPIRKKAIDVIINYSEAALYQKRML